MGAVTNQEGWLMAHVHSQEKVLARSQFFEANFDSFGQFSQKVSKIQKSYIPHWKALIFAFLEA